jgi:DNA-binding MarR family transcriptional regulator
VRTGHHGHDGDDSTRELLMRAVGGLRQAWREQLDPLGIAPHQARALHVIADAGQLRPSELARHLRIAPRSATEVIDGLVRDGLAQRTPSATDRRAVIVSLTERGHELMRQVAAARAASGDALFARLTHADEEALRRILHKLVDD